MMALTLLTPPAAEPLTLPETKNYLRVSHSADDGLIAELMVSARQMIENRLAMGLIDQSWQQEFCVGEGGRTRLLRTPVSAISAGVEITETGETAIDVAGIKILEPRRGLIETSFRQGMQLRLTFVVGFGDASAVPADMKQALRLLLAHFYENRIADKSVAGLPSEFGSILESYRERQL
jgi:uncharacterized phiE125 gp8 family phage protein